MESLMRHKWIVLAALAVAVWWFFFRDQQSTAPANTGGALGQIGRQIQALVNQRQGEAAHAGEANAGAAASAAAAAAAAAAASASGIPPTSTGNPNSWTARGL